MKSGSPPRGLSLKTVLESTADSVFVLDRDWRFAYLNPRAKAQIAGGRDLSGEVVWEAFPEARETAFWATYHKAMDEGVAASCEVFFRSLGAWFEANAYPIEGGIAVFFRDISQRRRAEEERETLLGRLEYEHTLLEAVVKQLPIGLIVAEAPGGKVLLHNEAARALLGEAVETLPDDAPLPAVRPDGAPYTPQDFPIARALASGEEIEREAMLYRREDGSLAHLTVSARPVRDESGRILAGVGTFDDVTELRGAVERHRLALAAANMGDWSWDAASDLMSFSERAREIFGFPPGEAVTRTRLRGYCDADDLATAETTIEDAAQRRTRYRVEYRYTRPNDGAVRWLVTMGHATSRPDGTLAGITGVVLDVTERKRGEERQQLLIRELHHRVKNTLATVQAIVGSTARTASSIDEFYQGFVGRIVSLARTHNLLTEDLWQKAALEELVKTELGPYEDEARNRITIEGPHLELPSEAAVPIGMAIHELTTNAAKHGALSTFGGQVEVRWRVEPGEERPMLHFSWVEHGGPRVSTPTRQGFGTRLLQRVLATQLQADVSMNFLEEGLHFSMQMPIPTEPPTFNPDT